jgi:Tol biopolymer transport system component
LDQERGKRDMPAAIKIYERILTDFSSNRALVARTLLQLGEANDKLGETAKAQEYYEQIMTKYPEQTDVVDRARTRFRSAPGEPPSLREFGIPAEQRLNHAFRNAVDISPDGKRIAFVAGARPSLQGSGRRIYLKDQFGDAAAIPGTEGAYGPFFSPDGQSLGFFSGNPSGTELQINRIALSPGSQPSVLLRRSVPRLESDNLGATWGKDGTIIIGSAVKGLQTIPDKGGTPQPLTTLDRAVNETSHRFPHFLPDGSGVIFTVTRNVSPRGFRSAQIWVLSLKTNKRKLFLENATDARPGPDNTLVFARDGQLFGVKFDVNTLSVSGSPVLMNEGAGVTHALRSDLAGARTGAAQYSVSTNGTLVFAPGSVEPAAAWPLIWVDQQGSVTPLGIQPREYYRARVSPDGKLILISGSPTSPDPGVWLFDTTTQELQKHISGDADQAVWESNTRFAFISNRDGPSAIYVKDIRSPEIKRVASGTNPVWTPDRGWMSMSDLRKAAIDPTPLPDIAASPENGAATDSPALRYQDLSLSPDGRWLAYMSSESGNQQLYVKPYPGPGPSVRVSGKIVGVPEESLPNLGPVAEVFWARDGQRLFYRMRARGLTNAEGSGPTMVSVSFSVSNGQFQPEPGIALFRNNGFTCTLSPCGDAAPDGRFIMIQNQSPEANEERNRKIYPSTLTVVLNWSTELRRALDRAR